MPRVLVTGAGGYLGRRIARSLLERGDTSVVLWSRDDDARSQALAHELAPYAGRFELAHGDLLEPAPFASVDPQGIDGVVHAAALTRFNVEREAATRVNVEGVRKLLEWSRACSSLERLTVLSTVYSSGLRSGELGESVLDDPPEFANHYERSKWEAERLLVQEGAGLPWQIHRIATVIAADDEGRVEQYNAFHNTLKLLHYGLLSVVPGRADTPLYFVTADFVAEAVRALMLGGSDQTVYHVCHARSESATLGELLDVAFRTFERDPRFVKRRILRPLLCDAKSFEALSNAVGSLGSPLVEQSLSSIAPFAPQLFSDKTVSNERLVAALLEYGSPEPRKLIERVCEQLVRSGWGKREVARV